MTCFFITHVFFSHDVCAEEMSNKWQQYSYLFLSLPNIFVAAVHTKYLFNLLSFWFASFFFLRIKNSYLCGIIGETRFFLSIRVFLLFFFLCVERQKQHFCASFLVKHTTFFSLDSRLNIGLVLAILWLFLGILTSNSSVFFLSWHLFLSCYAKLCLTLIIKLKAIYTCVVVIFKT